MTSPSLPRSLPVSTTTRSPFLIFMPCQSTSGASETMRMNFLSRSSRPTGPKMRVPRGVLVVLDEDGGVLVEADVAAVGTALLLLGADDDALHDVALLDGRAGDGVLHGGHEDVADRGVAAAGAAEHLDARAPPWRRCCRPPGAAISCWIIGCSVLRRSRTSTTRQRFSFDSGRVSCTRTRSPTLTSLASSWA